jgi:hypothetical protein
LYIAKVKLDLPSWVSAAVVALTVFLTVAIPAIAPMVVVMGIALLDGIVPGILENIESQTQQQLQSRANGLAVANAAVGPLPGLEAPDWWYFWQGIRYLSLTPESLDLAFDIWPAMNPKEEPRATIVPDSWSAMSDGPLKLTLKLRDDLEKLGGDNLMVKWTVWRKNTGKVVASAVKAYNDPTGNGPSLSLHTPELYLADAFDVQCTASLTLGSQVGDIWTGQKTIPILDNIDRGHSFVRWAHTVYFANAGTGNKIWWHDRRSCIHRTALSARCKMLREVAVRKFAVTLPAYSPEYFDKLPFGWDQLNANRKPLCEYCFFGGPDKSVPLPKEDWF